MHWQFWHRPMSEGAPANRSVAKLPKAKDLPAQLGQYLVVHRKLDPDAVWSLRCVERPRADDKRSFDFRLFNPAEAKASNCRVTDYSSLEDHPSLIRYSGRYSRDSFVPELDPDIVPSSAVEASNPSAAIPRATAVK